MVYSGASWLELSNYVSSAEINEAGPSPSELKQYPALKHAWDEYLITRKLLGLA